mmetsp:Transcript_11910/g.21799  ORF Transcript_11910/g.21799 Transcript_11910/m.21799 type:complete len:377 (-) Transcript_11910:57-1187(-)
MATQVLQCGGVLVYQLLCGREIKLPDGAQDMRNYCYLIVNTLERTGIAIDAAWNIDAVSDLATKLGIELQGSIYTHYHFDHCGGDVDPRLTGGKPVNLPGAKEVEKRGGRIWAGEGDAAAIRKQCHLEEITAMSDGYMLDCGDLILHILHTPGHTPGSLCVYAAPRCLSPRAALGDSPFREKLTKAEAGVLITGDTLFVGSCGRVDLPGSDRAQMIASLARISTFDPQVIVLPGHNYAEVPFTTVGAERTSNGSMMAGMQQVTKPRALPPCMACGEHGRGWRCGPKAFVIGRKVRIKGLSSEAGQALNGQDGVVQRFNDEKERYEVAILHKDVDVKMIRGENLEAPGSESQKQADKAGIESNEGGNTAADGPLSTL